MRVLYVFLFALFALSAWSQDQVEYRVCYRQTSKLSEDNSAQTSEMRLDINGDKSTFYSYWTRVRSAIKDSVLAVGGDYHDMMAAQDGIPRPHVHESLFFNYQADGSLLFQDVIAINNYQYAESIPTQQWELVEEDTTILGYRCQGAQCTFRGRTWRAFFTTEIPLRLGPWKLRGLPGLILFAQDTKRAFTYDAIQLKRKPDDMMLQPATKVMQCTRKDVMQLRRKMWNDPNGTLEAVAGIKSTGTDQFGRPIVYKPRTAVQQETDL